MLNCGDRVDRFVVEAVLGEGGLARVYRVRHEHLGGQYALKLLSFRGERLSKRLVREGRIQARLQHPNIVRVHDAFELEGRGALLMEFVDGPSLGQVLDKDGSFPLPQALQIFGQVLTGVGVAHEAGVLHRDLKPGNILLQTRGEQVTPKVTDFGIARLLSVSGPAGDTLQSEVIGTPGFMAPEQASDPTTVDIRADLFSLGAILYGMVTGWPPFPTSSLAEVLAAAETGDFVPVVQRVPSCPMHVAEAIERCLSPNPDDRFSSCRALAAALFGEDSTEVAAVELGSQHQGAGLAVADDEDSRLPQAASLNRDAPVLTDTVSEGLLPANATAVPTPTEEPAASGASGRESGTQARAVPVAVAALLALGLAAIAGFSRSQDPPQSDPTDAPKVASEQLPAAAPGPSPARPPADAQPGFQASPVTLVTPVTPDQEPSTPATPATPAPPSPPRPPPPVGTVASPAAPADAVPSPGVDDLQAEAEAAEPAVAVDAKSPSLPEQEASDAVADLTEAAPAEASVPPGRAAAGDAGLSLLGSWSGRLGGRPSRLRVTDQAGTEVKAVLEVLQGTAYRTFRLVGTLEGDRLRLRGTTEAPWRLDARLLKGALVGDLTAPGRKRATAWRGTRD